jgi:hypothetical protein
MWIMAEEKQWVVTISGGRPIGEVAKDLTKSGFNVDNVLDQIGSITGHASDDVIHHLRAVPGVADVSPDHPIDIGPPGAPVTW